MPIEVLNESGVDLSRERLEAFGGQVARALDTWSKGKKSPLSMFTRESFTQPSTRQQAFSSARLSTSDDAVASTIEFAEALGIERVYWESANADTTKRWNATLESSGLDQWIREAFWELSTIGVVTTAIWWGSTSYRPAGTGPGGLRAKRSKDSVMPQRLVTLPAERVFRLNTFWGTPKLLWIADDTDEADLLRSGGDDTMRRLIAGPYEPTQTEELQLSQAGLDPQTCLLLDNRSVFQTKLPGQDYGNGHVTPMTRVLPWLEQKARLMDSDRAFLVGAANFLLVIKIGTDDRPGTNEEADALREGLVRIAKAPFLLGDHRLSVEILSPDTTGVLNSDKHKVVNSRITAATLGLPDDSLLPSKLDLEAPARMATARIKARRHLLAVAARGNLSIPGAEQSGAPVEEAPQISFMPREIQLVGVAAAMNSALAARSRRDLSRHSYLETIGYDHDVERERIKDEADSGADDDFQTHQPFDSQNQNGGMPPGAMGPTGGRPIGDRTSKGGAKPKDGGQ